jgi:hypothetical protein
MKSITFASGTLVTSGAVAAALIEFVAQMTSTDSSVAVDIPVLEANGTITKHTILVSPSMQFDIVDIDGESGPYSEEGSFPAPEMPSTALMVAVVPAETAEEDAENFNQAVADIDHMLDQS